MPPDPDWNKRYRSIKTKITTLAHGFRQEITGDQDEVPASDSAEFDIFCFAKESVARKWSAAMVDASIKQLWAEAPSAWEHPDELWQFLPKLSRGVIAPALEELLRNAFRVTQRDIELLQGVGDDVDWSDPFEEPVFKSASVQRAWNKTNAVHEIVTRLLGVKRTLAFGDRDEPHFDMPAAQSDPLEALPIPAPAIQSALAEAKSEAKLDANLEMGKWIDKQLEAGARACELLRTGTPQEDVRKQFPQFFEEVVDVLPVPRQKRFLANAKLKMNQLDLVEYIAQVKGLKGSYALKLRSLYRASVEK